MLDYLKTAPKGILLEDPEGGAYNNSSAFALFSQNISAIGWPGHEYQWRGRILLAELPHHGQASSQRHPVGQSSLGGCLDGRPLGFRIGKRNPEFEDVCTTGDECVQRWNGCVEIRITGGDEGGQGLAS